MLHAPLHIIYCIVFESRSHLSFSFLRSPVTLFRKLKSVSWNHILSCISMFVFQLHFSTCIATSEFSLALVCFEGIFLISSTCLLCTTCFPSFMFNLFTIYYLFSRNQIELFCLPLAISSGKKTFVDRLSVCFRFLAFCIATTISGYISSIYFSFKKSKSPTQVTLWKVGHFFSIQEKGIHID